MIDATVFVYRNNSTGEIRCEYLDEAKTVDLNDYHHEATINPKMWVQYWFDAVAKLQAIINAKVA
tara:strand:+ start:6735 stop:6929 length:195 start_codon:yes stop_codon:yes gene_type:complete